MGTNKVLNKRVQSDPQLDPQQESISPLKDPPFWGISLGHTFSHWYTASFYILLPYITIELSLSMTQASLLVTGMYLTRSIVGMPLGAISDMVTRKNLLLAMSLALAGIPFIFFGLANTVWFLMILLCIMGIGSEMWHPASFSILSSRYPQQRGFVFGFHGMSANLGDLLAPAIIGALLTSVAWREMVYWNVIPGILVGTCVLFMFKKMDNNSYGVHINNGNSIKTNSINLADYWLALKKLFQNRPVILLATTSGITAMAQNGLMTFLPLYLAIEISLSPLLVGIYISTLQAGGLIAGPLAGAVSDKFGRKKVVYFVMVSASIMVILVTLVQVDWLLIGTIALIGFFIYALRPIMQAWAMESSAESMAGTTTSLLFTAQSIMASVSPLIGGILTDLYGFAAAFYFVAGVILIGTIVVSFIPYIKEV